MKKTLLILSALAALALASCTKVENFSSRENSGNEIGFATYTGRALTKSGTALGQSFNVEGFLSGTPASRYFYSTSYRYANNRYTGDTTRYWPSSGSSLDFYAVSPLTYTNTLGNDVDLKPVDSTITVAGIGGRTDIVAARLVNQSFIDPVTLNFGHKMTKVSFKAVGFDATKNYKISSITVNANSTAAYTYGPTEGWGTSSDENTYTFLNECKSIPAATTTPVALGDTLFLIPSQAATIKAQIRYSIYDGAIKIDTTVAPVEVNLPVSGVWGINKSVVYKLTLNISSTRNPINFSATVEDWDADTELWIPPHYVDNGIDYGPGTKVGNTIWAPVNCGYDSLNFKYGKLYQWGRVVGSGYIQGDHPDTPEDESLVTEWNDAGGRILQTATPTFTADSLNAKLGDADFNDYHYLRVDDGDDTSDWYSISAGSMLRAWPMKPGDAGYLEGKIGNPCPEGWRVPTMEELCDLFCESWTPGEEGYISTLGYYDEEKHGWNVRGVFFPSAGIRYCDSQIEAGARNKAAGYWSSTSAITQYGVGTWAAFIAPSSTTVSVMAGIGTDFCRADGYSVRCVIE